MKRNLLRFPICCGAVVVTVVVVPAVVVDGAWVVVVPPLAPPQYVYDIINIIRSYHNQINYNKLLSDK